MTAFDASNMIACPLCGYDLRAAVGPARCPECGILTGAGTRCFWPSGRRRKFFLLTGASVVLILIPYTISASRAGWRPWSVITFVNLTGAAYYLFSRARMARATQGASVLCVTSEEVACRRGVRVERIQWSDVTDVLWSEFYEVVTIRTDRTVLTVPVWLCPVEMTFREFGGFLHAWWASHGTMQNPGIQARAGRPEPQTNDYRRTGSVQSP